MAVLPSSLLKIQQAFENQFDGAMFNNMALRLGIVVDIFDVESEQNQSKILTEYDVMTIEQDGPNGINTAIYNNCFKSEGFGSFADFFESKLRKPKNPKGVRNKGSFKDEKASIVLLLCIDGNSEKGIIIGSLKNAERPTTIKDGHSLEGEFNGLNWQVNDDGEFTLTFKGKTDIEGKPVDEKASGSNLKYEKDGSINLTDGNKEYLRIDKTEKAVSAYAEKAINLASEGSASITSKEGTSLTAAELVVSIEGSTTVETGSLNIKSEGAIDAKSNGGKFDFGSSLDIKASSTNIKSTNIQLGQGGTPAVTNITQAIGIGVFGVPVISGMVGPFSSTVFIAP